MTKTGISGVILAGGASYRFGGITKSNVIVGGKTIISRIIEVIEDLFREIIIVTNKPQEFLNYSRFTIVSDLYPKAGPAGGIHAAIRSSSHDAVFVFAGDMPFLDKNLIISQIAAFEKDKHDIFVPRTGSFIEPLHAIYRKSVLERIETFITEKHNRSLKDLILEADAGFFLLPDNTEIKKAFTNINSPSDLHRINILFKT